MEKPLVVLDLNGVLIHRVHESFLKNKNKSTFVTPNGYHVFVRPYVKGFLTFLFKHFDVAVWTCMNKQNANFVLERLLTRTQKNLLKFVYTQKECDLEDQLFYKRISKLPYKTNNVVFIDDSPHKVRYNPPYTAIHPKSYTNTESDNGLVMIRKLLETYLNGSNVPISMFLKNQAKKQEPVSILARIYRFFFRTSNSI